MATYQTLLTYYGNVMRVSPAALRASEASTLQGLATQIDAGQITLTEARSAIEKLAVSTTSVANLSYQFFTGGTPWSGGLNYLVSPTGPNANNLNSAYYQSFNLENRYINFAVNLGKAGEGATKFAADYGALTLSAATEKAYAQIFGVTPDAAKLSALLNDQVPNGLGGTYTRAEYFASYGADGLNGIATKAAMVGWLLAAAAKEDVGVYAKANDAFLSDLSVDGMANFHVDLLGTYGAQPTYPAGVTITVAANQSVSLAQASANSDTVTGAAGLDAGQSIIVGDGNDVVTFAGLVKGFLDTGPGNDVVTIGGGLERVVGVQNSGLVSTGLGNDKIVVTGGLGDGGLVDGGLGDDTLETRTVATGGQTYSVEHIYVTGATFTGTPVDPNDQANIFVVDASTLVGVHDIWNISRANSSLDLRGVGSDVILGLRNTGGGLSASFNGVENAELHLDHVDTGSYSNMVVMGRLFGTLTVHVDSDSRVGTLRAPESGTIVIRGVGAFTAATVSMGYSIASNPDIYIPFNRTITVDASAAARVDIGVIYPWSVDNVAILSGGDDVLGLDLSHGVKHTITLGAGADLLKINSATLVGVTSPQFSNVVLTDGKVTAYATVTDFQKGADHLDLGAASTTQATGLQAFVGAATTLEQALTNVSSHVAAGAFGVFEFGGDSYVYRQNGDVGLTYGDGLIKLVGVTGLTVGTGATVADIHYGAAT